MISCGIRDYLIRTWGNGWDVCIRTGEHGVSFQEPVTPFAHTQRNGVLPNCFACGDFFFSWLQIIFVSRYIKSEELCESVYAGFSGIDISWALLIKHSAGKQMQKWAFVNLILSVLLSAFSSTHCWQLLRVSCWRYHLYIVANAS